MKIYSIFLITLLASACSGLNKSPESTSSAKAAYGTPDLAPIKKTKERERERKIKVKHTKPKNYSRSAPNGWQVG